jgi:hypothetical protein
MNQALMAHTGNPSYLGSRHQEDRGSKPAQANSFRDPISKKPITKKKGLVEWLKDVGPEFKPQYWKKKKMSWGSQKKPL